MHDEHRDDRHIREDNELAKIDDCRKVARGHDVCDECHDAVGGESDDHLHDAHHDAVEAIDDAAEEIGLLRIAIAKLQISKSHKSREDDHGNGRCRASARQVGEDVRRDKRQDGLRDRGVFVILDSDLWTALRRAVRQRTSRPARGALLDSGPQAALQRAARKSTR